MNEHSPDSRPTPQHRHDEQQSSVTEAAASHLLHLAGSPERAKDAIDATADQRDSTERAGKVVAPTPCRASKGRNH